MGLMRKVVLAPLNYESLHMYLCEPSIRYELYYLQLHPKLDRNGDR